VSLKHSASRALAASLAAAALMAPAALGGDLRTPDARYPAARAQRPLDVSTDAVTPGEAIARLRASDGPTIVQVTAGQGFDWASAGIGAGAGIALALIVLAAASTAGSRSRPAPR
jgi:hypothetical protein